MYSGSHSKFVLPGACLIVALRFFNNVEKHQNFTSDPFQLQQDSWFHNQTLTCPARIFDFVQFPVAWIIGCVVFCIYATVESFGYWMFCRQKARLRTIAEFKPSVDSDYHPAVCRLLLDLQSRNDLAAFLKYSFLGTANDFSQLPRDAVNEFLTRNTETSDMELVGKIEKKLNVSFCETPVNRGGGHDNPLKSPKSTGPAYWEFGNGPLDPFYRPVLFVITIHLLHFVSCRILLPILGYRLVEAKNVHMRRCVRYFVLDSKDLNKPKDNPVLWIHGFGCGLLPYIPSMCLLWWHQRKQDGPSRPIIFVEFLWFGLMPGGGTWRRTEIQEGLTDLFRLATSRVDKARIKSGILASNIMRILMSILFCLACFCNSLLVLPTRRRRPSKGRSLRKGKTMGCTSGVNDLHVPLCKFDRLSVESAGGSSSEDSSAEEPDHTRPLDLPVPRRGSRLLVSSASCPSLMSNCSRSIPAVRKHFPQFRTLPEIVEEIAEFVATEYGDSVDVISHSYGTAVTSLLKRLRPNIMRKCVLMDPICFFPQITKKAQLVHRSPFQVVLYDRSYSGRVHEQHVNDGSSTDEGDDIVESVQDYSRIGRCIDYVTDKVLLVIYWYVVFRDFGTRWTTSRQLQGHEYLDRGDLTEMGRRLMVVTGSHDLITPSDALVRYLSRFDVQYQSLRGNHHGIAIMTPSVLWQVMGFLSV